MEASEKCSRRVPASLSNELLAFVLLAYGVHQVNGSCCLQTGCTLCYLGGLTDGVPEVS